MKKIKILFIAILSLFVYEITAQNQADSVLIKEEFVKKGWNFGALPSILYNTDLGFQYGALVDLFHYGDGTKYPDYNYEIYAEWSRTTKGGGINQLYLDAHDFMGTKLQLQVDVSYLTQLAMDFYGFNGYETNYNPEFIDNESDQYISRMFYNYERKMLRACFMLRGPLVEDKLFWLAGFGHYGFDLGTVDIENLNKGRAEDDKLPDTALLYDKYVEWGLISEAEKEGGDLNIVRFGLSFDTRDNHANPMKGIWSELLVATVPGFINGDNRSYTKLALTHRQYFTLVPKNLSLACRVAWQGVIAGDEPWYMHNYMVYSSPETTTVDGLGGTKTLRGILRDRVVGDGVAYGNFELRWKALYFSWIKQNFYLGVSGFVDMGMVVDKTELDLSLVPEDQYDRYFTNDDEQLHTSLGGGISLVMNQNFVLGVNYGKALNTQDGTDGLYIGLNYLF